MAKAPSIPRTQFPPYHPVSDQPPHAFPQDCPETPNGVLMTILEARAASSYFSTTQPPQLSLHRRTVGLWPARAHSTLSFPAECQKGAPCPKLPSTRNSQDIAHHSEVPDLRAGHTGPPPTSLLLRL